MALNKTSSLGLLGRHEYDDPSYPFSTGDWTADAGSLSIASNKLRLTVAGVNFNRVLYNPASVTGDMLVHSVASRGGNLDHMLFALVSDITFASFTGLEGWVSCGYSGRQRQNDFSSGTPTLIDDTPGINKTDALTRMSLWGDAANQSWFVQEGTSYQVGAQVNNPHTGKAGFGARYANADLERFFVMAGKYITVTDLGAGEWIKILSGASAVLASAQESGSGTVQVDCSQMRIDLMATMVRYQSDGTTPIESVAAGIDDDSAWPGETWSTILTAEAGKVTWAEMEVPNPPGIITPVIAIMDNIAAAGGALIARVPEFVRASITRDRRGRHEMVLTGPRSASWAEGRVRGETIFTMLHNEEVFEWRISSVKDGVGPRKEPITVIIGDPLEVDLMDCGPIRTVVSGGLTSYFVEWENKTPTEIIDDIILPALADYGLDWIARGTVDPTLLLTGAAEMVTPGELLSTLETETGAYYRLRPDGLTGYFLDLVDDLSDGRATARVRDEVNLMELARSRSGEDIATVIIVRGAESDGFRPSVGLAEWEVTAIVAEGSSKRITVIDPDGGAGPIVIAEQFVGNGLPASNPARIVTHYLRFPDGTLEEILDTDTPGDFVIPDSTGLSVGDRVVISPDNAGTIMTEIHSPTGLGLYGRVARYYDMDVGGTDNASENPLANDWATVPSSFGCQLDGVGGLISGTIDITNGQPDFEISTGDSIIIWDQSFGELQYITASGPTTVDDYGEASIPIAGSIQIPTNSFIVVFDNTDLPDDWTNETANAYIDFGISRRVSSDTADLTCEVTALANGSAPRGGTWLGTLDEGDRIYAGDRIIFDDASHRHIMHDAVVDENGEVFVVFGTFADAAPQVSDAITIERPEVGAQESQTGTLTLSPTRSSASGAAAVIQGPDSPVRLIAGLTKLWASAAFYVVNQNSDVSVTVEVGEDHLPPIVGLWDGASILSSLQADSFVLAPGEAATVILRTSAEIAAEGDFAVRATGVSGTPNSSIVSQYLRQEVVTSLLWLELQLSEEEPDDAFPIQGASARVLHQAANATLLQKHLWPTAIEVSARELVEYWGVAPTEPKLTLGQTVRVTETTLGIDVELVVDRIQWRLEDPENPRYILGTAEQDLSERLVRALSEGSGSATVTGVSGSSGTSADRYTNAEIDALLLAGFGVPFTDADSNSEPVATRVVPVGRNGVMEAMPTLGSEVIVLRGDGVTREDVTLEILD